MFRTPKTAMRMLYALACAFVLTTAASADTLVLKADLSAREIRAIIDGQEVARYDVAIGKDDKPTPTGSFKIRKLVWNPRWVPPDEKWARGKSPKGPWDPDNPMKRVKIFFKEPDYYIHGTGAEDSLGKAESHGCLRMSPREVTELAKLVMEHGGKPMPEPWYRRILHRRTTKVIYLTNPVAIEVVR